LTESQEVTFSTIVSILVANGIETGQSGSSPVFSSGATQLPSCPVDMKHFYTATNIPLFAKSLPLLPNIHPTMRLLLSVFQVIMIVCNTFWHGAAAFGFL
jgi:hypothetical protein